MISPWNQASAMGGKGQTVKIRGENVSFVRDRVYKVACTSRLRDRREMQISLT